jgi:asparagine synthase (glutamine-hydrolysing)
MCGIAGYITSIENHSLQRHLDDAIVQLKKRGPDIQKAVTLSPKVGFGHARLSIIDTSNAGTQPMFDETGRYAIIFNGEIFNFRELKESFLSDLKHFQSHSDTEVLLQLFIKMGKDCLQHLNGFFAFAIYDNVTKSTFVARDRYGIKPLLYFKNESSFFFASELKSLMRFPIKKEIDFDTLALYLQLNYVPGNNSMLKGVSKLPPGHFITVKQDAVPVIERYYEIPYTAGIRVKPEANYESSKLHLRQLVDEAVKRRLISDVPLGAFLSGGIDSSIVVSCASKHVSNLHTFSIGFKDEPYFDETKYANLVAKKFGTEHTVFSISNDEMFANLHNVLDYIDEPFADSSAIAVYILSQKTRQAVTVSLSGDGGDELFAGYNKHQAELRARQNNLSNFLLKIGSPIFDLLPQSRNSKYGNLFRQLSRYSSGLQLNNAARYWRWCVLSTQTEALEILLPNKGFSKSELENRMHFVVDYIKDEGDINDTLFADMQMVLPNDMLTKVDLMSMANSLEVRVPLLDYTVVNYAFSLPAEYKIEKGKGKKILKDAFREELPDELFNRPKHGFEVPLLKWMRTGLKSLIMDDLLADRFLEEQNIFKLDEIQKLKRQLFSSNPGDIHARIWGLIVFQYWYKKYFANQ